MGMGCDEGGGSNSILTTGKGRMGACKVPDRRTDGQTDRERGSKGKEDGERRGNI